MALVISKLRNKIIMRDEQSSSGFKEIDKAEVSTLSLGLNKLSLDMIEFQNDKALKKLREKLFSFIFIYPSAVIEVINLELADSSVIDFFASMIDENRFSGELTNRAGQKELKAVSINFIVFIFSGKDEDVLKKITKHVAENDFFEPYYDFQQNLAEYFTKHQTEISNNTLLKGIMERKIFALVFRGIQTGVPEFKGLNLTDVENEEHLNKALQVVKGIKQENWGSGLSDIWEELGKETVEAYRAAGLE